MERIKYMLAVNDLKIRLMVGYIAVVLNWLWIISDEVFDGYMDSIDSDIIELKSWELNHARY